MEARHGTSLYVWEVAITTVSRAADGSAMDLSRDVLEEAGRQLGRVCTWGRRRKRRKRALRKAMDRRKP